MIIAACSSPMSAISRVPWSQTVPSVRSANILSYFNQQPGLPSYGRKKKEKKGGGGGLVQNEGGRTVVREVKCNCSLAIGRFCSF